MKYIAIVAVVIASIGIGSTLAGRLKRRVNLLEQLKLLLGFIQTEVEYAAHPVAEMLHLYLARHPDNLPFLEDVLKKLDGGTSLPDAWSTAVDDEFSDLLHEDKEILKAFGNELGASDIAGQVNLCQMYTGLLEEQLKAAKEKEATQGKLCRRLSVFAGLAAVIIFI